MVFYEIEIAVVVVKHGGVTVGQRVSFSASAEVNWPRERAARGRHVAAKKEKAVQKIC